MDNILTRIPFPINKLDGVGLESAEIVLDCRPCDEATSVRAITEMDSNFSPIKSALSIYEN